MLLNKAYKFKIEPNDEQCILLAKTFGCCRFVYNRMLNEKISYYEEAKAMLKTTPAKYKKEFDWLKEVDSLALANEQLHLETAYKNFFKKPDTGFPKYKSKKADKNSYTTNVVNGNIRIENGYIKLPKLGLVKIRMHRAIPKDHKIKSVTVSRTSDYKYYASILTEYEKNIVPKETNEVLGLDFSMKELYVDSNGNEPNFPKYYRQSEKKLAREQRKLSFMEKGSNNYIKQKKKIAIIHRKIANQRKDFLHKESRKITNSYDAVCIENLNMQAMAQALKFGKSVNDNGWGMFTTFLKYKLEEEGKILIKVDKFFASSQICHVCGNKNPKVKDLKVREWICPHCKTHHNRDVNAAINIKNEGIRLLTENLLAA